jgi:hypothetical protein
MALIQGSVANRRWDFGILVPGVSYAANAPVPVVPPQTRVFRVTRPLTISAKVGEIQQALSDRDLIPRELIINMGRYRKGSYLFSKTRGLVDRWGSR